jgi:ribosomal protein S19E (S16A)
MNTCTICHEPHYYDTTARCDIFGQCRSDTMYLATAATGYNKIRKPVLSNDVEKTGIVSIYTTVRSVTRSGKKY